MKRTIVSLLALAVLFGLGTDPASGGVPASAMQYTPGMINYQGMLVTPGPQGGAYVDGSYTFDIRLYRELSGGTAVWGGTYTTYVKSGYFNIMLGGETGVALAGPTYAHNALWKALWPDPATPENLKNSLFLAITPYQDAYCQFIQPASRAELAPRQNLLAAPYAFRAQTAAYAEYANQSTNFVVNGKLTASYAVGGTPILKTFVGGYPATTPWVQIGLGSDVPNTVSITSMGLVTQSETVLHDTETKEWFMVGDFDVDSSGPVTIDAGSTAKLIGTTGATVSGGSGTLSLQGAKVQGRNALEWSKPSSSSTYAKPFVIRQYTVVLASGASQGYLDISDTVLNKVSDYAAAITAVRPTVTDSAVGDALSSFHMTTGETGNAWKIYLQRDTPITTARNYVVDVLFINKYLIDDNR